MKKIILQFYGCYNLGDDLFVKVFSEHFPDCRIRLLGNPRCVPQGLGEHVSVHPFSWTDMALRKGMSLCDRDGVRWMCRLLDRVSQSRLNGIRRGCDAFVRIGGSVFMEHAPGCTEIDFATEQAPDFRFENGPVGPGNTFIIGANLGPVYSEGYWDRIEDQFRQYRHVCLRDYASYCKMRHLPQVQYAPDVLFLVPKPEVPETGENVVISVIDMANHTDNDAIIEAYERLLEQAVVYFSDRGIPVTLVSFCQWQGDEAAANRLLERVGERENVSTCFYRGDAAPVLEALARATYVIGSRFHSIILGLSFGKCVFPNLYNCKTRHYLKDLRLSGKSAEMEDLPGMTLEDVLYNYRNHIQTDCTDHRRYAENQFRGLREYLKNREESRVENGIV